MYGKLHKSILKANSFTYNFYCTVNTAKYVLMHSFGHIPSLHFNIN